MYYLTSESLSISPLSVRISPSYLYRPITYLATMSQYLAGPNTSACLDAVKHSGAPVGSKTTIGDIEAYISYPPTKSTDLIIFFFCDVFGPWYVNNQLLMDFFAQAGSSLPACCVEGG